MGGPGTSLAGQTPASGAAGASGKPLSSIHQEHVVLLVHGLSGSARHWEVMREKLATVFDPCTTLLHVSTANEGRKTRDGIDTCGQRLADEIRCVVAEHPSLQRISFVAHSMGGLISRWAAGRLFDPESRTLLGLQPCHFVTMATPHLGCDGGRTEAEVPMLRWAGAVPLIGGAVQFALKSVAAPYAGLVYGRSGSQFFFQDGEGSRQPLLLRLAQDSPEEGVYFYSALAAFATRTAYANASGDYFVGWANASLRRLEELPQLPARGRGVQREDPLEASWHPGVLLVSQTVAEASLQSAAGSENGASSRHLARHSVGGGGLANSVDVMKAGAPPASISAEGADAGSSARCDPPGSLAAERAEQGEAAAAQLDEASRRSQQGSQDGHCHSHSQQGSLEGGSGGVLIERQGRPYWALILDRLQQLPWRRVDCCFSGSKMPFLAHRHIQVQRRLSNSVGMQTIDHLARQLVAMEGALKTRYSGNEDKD